MKKKTASPTESFDWSDGFLLIASLLPLIFFPFVLDLYDLPKRACLNLLVLVFFVVHAFFSWRESGGLVLAGGPLAWPMTAYALAIVFSTFKAANVHDALEGSMQQGMPMLLAAILLARRVSGAAMERYVTVSICAATLATVIGLIQYCGVDTEPWGIRQVVGPASLFGNKNMAAEYILMMLPLVLYRAARHGFGSAYPWLASAIVAFLFATRTKAVWVGMTAVLLIAGAHWAYQAATTRLQRPRQPGGAPSEAGQWMAWGVTVLIFLVLVNLPKMLHENREGGLRTLTSAVDTTHYSLIVRVALWANSLPMLAHDPLLGVGPGNWYIHYPLFASSLIKDPTFSTSAQAEHAHNDLVQIVGEKGLLGLAAFLWILVTLGRVALSHWRRIGTDDGRAERGFFFALSMLAILIDGLFAYPLHLAPGAGTFWILAAFLVASRPDGKLQSVVVPGGVVSVGVLALLATSLGAREVNILAANAYYRIAAVHMAGNQFGPAAEALKRSIEFDGHRYRTHSVLGRALIGLNKPDEAIEQYQQALECHPNQINVMYNMAQALRGKNRTEEALQALDRALAVVPSFTEALYLKGTYLKEAGKKPEAIQTFEKLTQAAPKYADAYNEMGNLLKESRRFTEAEQNYRKALEAKPDYGEVHNNLGVVFLEQGLFAQSIPHFEQAIEKSPAYPGTYFNLGRSLGSVGRYQEAIDNYRKFLDRWTGDAGTRAAAEGEIQRLQAVVGSAQRPPGPSPAPAAASPAH